jgi:pimeloyl-ACP methyl ester carboxylesterase
MNERRYRAAEQAFWESYSSSPTDRWLDLRRPPTRVRVQEVGDGPPLVFLHGGPGAGALFAPLVSLLPDFRCITIDRPGCALSPPISYAGERVDELMADVVSSCLDALDIDRARLVTSSFGGSCVLWLAQRYPDRVARICHLGCPAFLAQSKLPFMVKLMATPGLGFVAARLPMNRSGVKTFMRSMGERHLVESERLPKAFIDWWIALGRDTDTMRNEREAIRNAVTWRGPPKDLLFTDESIQSLEHPMYFYWGADEPFAKSSYAVNLVRGMKNATIDVVPNAGHIPWFGEREDAAERVRSFMNFSHEPRR